MVWIGLRSTLYIFHLFSMSYNPIENQSQQLVLSKASSAGIKVDKVSPTYPWRDIVWPIIVRAWGWSAPVLSAFQWGVQLDYAFNTNDVIDNIVWHIDHDWDGGDIHAHLHRGQNGTAISWNFIVERYVTVAKWHQQGIFWPEKTIVQTIACNIGTFPRRQHNISEFQLSNVGGDATHIDRALLEPDSLIKAAIKITTIPTITWSASLNRPFIFTADGHYQSTGVGSKNKAPNFYS